MWEAILLVDPYPTPYYSDWDANPDISTLTLINTTADAQVVRIHFNVTDQGNRVVVSGSSEPELIAGGATVIYDSPYDVAGSTMHDTEMEEVAARTGRMPEGDYTACAVAVDASGFVLAESCAPFTIVYPDPPLLIGPMDGEVIDQVDPLFLWTPVQVPADYQLTYVMRLVEVELDQTPAQALRENLPHFESLDGQMTSLRYPLGGQALEDGKTYAWTVQAIDQNGYTAAANDGRSEIWSFRYGESAESPANTGTTTLTLTNSTDASADAPKGLADICRTVRDGRLPPTIALGMDVDPSFTAATTKLPVSVYYDSQTEDWAVIAQSGAPTYLLYGNCKDALGGLGGLRWIARRANGVDLTGPSTTPNFSTHLEWKFAVMILSLSEWKAGADMPESFTAPQNFMEGYEVSVKPGLNVFGSVNLPANEGLSQVLQFLGYDQSYLELQGFLGLKNTFSIGGTIGQTVTDSTTTGNYTASANVAVTFLSLRASLPRREPPLFKWLIEWKQPTLELTGKVKAGVIPLNADSKADWTKAELEFELGFSIAAMFRDQVERTVTIAFVNEPSLDRPAGVSRMEHFWANSKAVLKLESDNRLYLTADSSLSIGDPAFELEIALNDLSRRLRTGEGITGKMSGQVGIGAFDDIGILEGEVGKKDLPPGRPHSRTIDERSDTTTTRPRSDTNADQTTRPTLTEPTGAIYWKAGMKLGNMSLGEFFRLIASFAAAVQQ